MTRPHLQLTVCKEWKTYNCMTEGSPWVQSDSMNFEHTQKLLLPQGWSSANANFITHFETPDWRKSFVENVWPETNYICLKGKTRLMRHTVDVRLQARLPTLIFFINWTRDYVMFRQLSFILKSKCSIYSSIFPTQNTQNILES